MTHDTDHDPLNRDFSKELEQGRFKPVQFEYAPKDAKVNLRMPSALLQALKAKAERSGIPYQRYIRQLIETDIGSRDGG